MAEIWLHMDRGFLFSCCALAAVTGMVFGSFLNCAAWRIARGESFVKGRSRCPSCGHVLSAADLIPLLSWLFLKGKCRYCGERVSVRYPLTECLSGAMFVLCLLRFGPTVLCLRNMIFGCCLLCLSLTDLESLLIPDGCLLIAAAAWVLTLPFSGMSLPEIGISAATGLGIGAALLFLSLFMDRKLGRESLGGGDIKLFAVAGLYLGPVGTLFGLLLSCVLGLLFSLSRPRGKAFPFGPAIAASAWIVLLYGQGLVDWYLGLLK